MKLRMIAETMVNGEHKHPGDIVDVEGLDKLELLGRKLAVKIEEPEAESKTEPNEKKKK